MRSLTHLLLTLALTLGCFDAVLAQEGVLWVQVSNPQGDAIPGVVLSVAGPGGSTSPPTASNGLTHILVGTKTAAGQEVELIIVRAPANMVLISPWHRYVTVPCFADSKCRAKVVLAERGSRWLLENGEAASAMVSLVVSKLRVQPGDGRRITDEEWRQAVLAEVANQFGLKPAEVDRAIREWKPKPEDKRAEGLQKFYAGKISEARVAFTESKALRKAGVAEDAFLEGWAYYNEGKYREAIDSYREALTYRPDDARVLFRLGQTYDIVGKSEQAEKAARRALELSEKTYGPVHLEVAACATSLASVYYNRNDHERGVPLMERAAEIKEQLKGSENPEVLHDLANVAVGYLMLDKLPEAEQRLRRVQSIAERGGDPASVELAYILNALGPIYYRRGDIAETERTFQRSLDVLRGHFDRRADKAQARREGAYNYAQAAGFLGYIYKQQGRLAKAEPLLKEAVEYEELEGPLVPSDVVRLDTLAELYVMRGNFAAAGELVERSLNLVEPAFGAEHTDVIQRVKLLAYIYETQKRFADAERLRTRVLGVAEKGLPEGLVKEFVEQAEYYGRRGRHDEADAYFSRAAELAGKIAREHPGALFNVTLSMLKYYQKREMFAEVEQLYKNVGHLSELFYGSEPAYVGVAPALMARFYQQRGRYAEAESQRRLAEEAVEKALGADHIAMIQHLHYRAELYEVQKRFDEAEKLYKRSVSIAGKAGESDYDKKITALSELAKFYMRRKRYQQAEPLYTHAQSVVGNAKGADGRARFAVLLDKAELYVEMGRYAAAESIYRDFLSVVVKEEGPRHPKVGMLYELLAGLAHRQGKRSEAEDHYKRALAIFEQEVGPEDASVAKCLEGYAALLRAAKRHSEAAALDKRAGKIRAKPTVMREDEK